MKKAVTVAIVTATLVLAAASVFALYDVNYFIQSKPNPVQVTNYSASINSLQPQINAISNNVSSLTSLKGDISDIRGKLVDLESKLNQAEQQASQSSRPVVILDRSIYLQGDTVFITAVGLDPQKPTQIQLVDSKGSVVTQVTTSSDSVGRLRYNLSLPATILAGNYQIEVTSGQLATWQPIMIVARDYSSSVILSGPYLFNVQTDHAAYLPSDVIEVYGTGKPYTNVSGVLTSPSGMTLTSNTTVQADGTFVMFFANSQPFETGLWHVSATDQGLNKVLSVSIVGTNNSSDLAAFTAQSDFGIYQAGEQVNLSGVAQPYTTVSASFTSPSGKLYITSTVASFDGTYNISFSTASTYETGYWNVNVTNQGQTKGFSIYVTSTQTSHSFTAQTDKTIYVKGQQIQISGTGKAYTTVKAELQSPSGTIYSKAITSNADGSFVMSFSTASSFETGNWHVSITNWSVTKVISIFLEP